MLSLDSCLKGKKSVAIAGHIRPDGDCTGSCLAVYNYIREYYSEIQVDLYLEPIPEKFLFLKNAEQIQSMENADTKQKYDLFIALDCGDTERLGDVAVFFDSAYETLCVDHHVTNQSFADINYIYPRASSASELVYELMDQEKITKEIAECLYLGIAHDTGIFQYSCTSPKTMWIAGKLMEKGINYPKIVDETYYIKSFNQQRIWGKAMLDSRLCCDGKCIYSILTLADMDEFHVNSKELDGIVSQLRSTIGVEVAIFLYETADGYKASLRSASYVDVAKIAVEFGGGGHARAAGASMKGKDTDIILQSLLERVETQLAEDVCTTES